MQWEYHQQTFGHETTIIVKWILYIGAKNRCGYLVLVIGLIAKLLNFCLKKHQGGSIFRGAPSWMSLSDLFCDLFPLMFRAMNQVLDVWWILPLKSTQPTIYYIAGGSAVSSTFSTFHAALEWSKGWNQQSMQLQAASKTGPIWVVLRVRAHTHTHTSEGIWSAREHLKTLRFSFSNQFLFLFPSRILYSMWCSGCCRQETSSSHPKSSLTSV